MNDIELACKIMCEGSKDAVHEYCNVKFTDKSDYVRIYRVTTLPGKSWKLMEFSKTIFQAWKVMENSQGHGKSWKIMMISRNFL